MREILEWDGKPKTNKQNMNEYMAENNNNWAVDITLEL